MTKYYKNRSLIGKPIYTLSGSKKPKKSGLMAKVLLITLVGGASIWGSLPSGTEEMNLKYQGFFAKEGENIMVFDPNPENERMGKPKYQIPSGLDTNLYNLETDKNYKIKVEKHNLGSFFPDKVISMSEDKRSN